jgi:hypothetical protein
MPQKASDFYKTITDDRVDKDGNIVLSVEDLINELAGNTAFTFDQIIAQLANSDDESEDFIVNYRDLRYKVPIASIREYFEEHEKPEQPMTLKEENQYLRDKLMEAMDRIKELEGSPDAKPKEKKKPAPKEAAKEAFQGKDMRTANQPMARNQKRMPTPPPTVEEPTEDLDSIREGIKKDLEGRKAHIANRDGKEGVL